MTNQLVLTLSCKDAVGIVTAVSSAQASAEAFIAESSHFGDEDSGHSFMRTVFWPQGKSFITREDFTDPMVPVVRYFDMDAVLYPVDELMKVLLAVSKQGHRSVVFKDGGG